MTWISRAKAALGINVSRDDIPVANAKFRIKFIETILIILGWPKFSEEKYFPGLRTIVHASMIIICLPMDMFNVFLVINQRIDNFSEIIYEKFAFIAIQIIGVHRIHNFIFNRKIFSYLVNSLLIEYVEEVTDNKRRDIMKKSGLTFWRLFLTTAGIYTITGSVMTVKIILYHTPKCGLNIPFVDNNISPYVEMQSALTWYFFTTQMMTSFASTHTFSTIAALVCIHIDCLSIDFEELSEAAILNDRNKAREVIRAFAIKYNKLNNATKALSNLYRIISCLQPLYTACIIITCMLLFGNKQSPLFLQMAITHVLEMFVYCYVGHMVTEKLYNTQWFALDVKLQQDVLISIQRCQRAFTLDAILFGSLSRELYANTLKMTYSVFTVLQNRA